MTSPFDRDPFGPNFDKAFDKLDRNVGRIVKTALVAWIIYAILFLVGATALVIFLIHLATSH